MARDGIKGGAEKPWKTRRRNCSRRGPAPERRPIENDPAFKTYIAKLNKPEKPLARPNYLDCVGAAYAVLKSMGIPITDHSVADLVRRKEKNPRNTRVEKALIILKSTPPVRTNTVHASRMVGLFKANFVPLSIHIWVKSGRPTNPADRIAGSWCWFGTIITPPAKALVEVDVGMDASPGTYSASVCIVPVNAYCSTFYAFGFSQLS